MINFDNLKCIKSLILRGYIFRDIKNIILFGFGNAPKSFERIWLYPDEILKRTESSKFRRKDSAKILAGNWIQDSLPLDTHPKIKACKKHFINGETWQSSGIYSYMLGLIEKYTRYDNCTSQKDLDIRYSQLDSLYEELKHSKKFKTQSQLIKKRPLRERGGILIHVSENCELIFGGAGCHRLAIAQSLKLDLIPAQIGVVHPKAVNSGIMKVLRSNMPRKRFL